MCILRLLNITINNRTIHNQHVDCKIKLFFKIIAWIEFENQFKKTKFYCSIINRDEALTKYCNFKGNQS